MPETACPPRCSRTWLRRALQLVLTVSAFTVAAAELLLDGYPDIDGPGAARLTEKGRGPGPTPLAHPLSAARPEAVRRYDPEPVSIGWTNRYDMRGGRGC
ncbi:hypothetical protein ACFWWM_34380 [Streptomyces sp. NPDC058682]|uniref:hypothetical protein n=1 Tax=unclassified Streptomyces TaxID=2593676 RepID=UPI002256153E|nr:hypothetical protein [Streptomyces sp. NBC_01214]MCX4803657.1 hypothetical protein [Streptomyces sp. NBC_01214]